MLRERPYLAVNATDTDLMNGILEITNLDINLSTQYSTTSIESVPIDVTTNCQNHQNEHFIVDNTQTFSEQHLQSGIGTESRISDF